MIIRAKNINWEKNSELRSNQGEIIMVLNQVQHINAANLKLSLPLWDPHHSGARLSKNP